MLFLKSSIYSVMHRNKLFVFFLFLLCIPLAAQPLSDEQIIKDFSAYPYRSAGGACPYYDVEFKDTPAPAGYKPFYVSHLSRHGSRFQNTAAYKTVVSDLDALHKAGLLTEVGDTLRNEIKLIYAATHGYDMNLTRKGTREQTKIAKNLVRRCPEIFEQEDRRIATFTATIVQRTIQSLAGFEAGILASAPTIEPEISSGFEDLYFKKASDKGIDKEELKKIAKEIERGLKPSPVKLARLRTLILKDETAAASIVSNNNLYYFIKDVFNAACTAACLDLEIDPLRFFTPEEMLIFYKVRDARLNANYGVLDTTRQARSVRGKPWVRRIVDGADDAIEGNGHCADFRFAHDGDIGPMMNLLAIGPFQYTSSKDEPYRMWQSYNYIRMASNFQLLFYKNAEKDILVKALYNEKEIDFPGLKAVNGVYYKWSDVRRYMISKCDEVREVPKYYSAYLKKKSEQIKKLQKDEAQGFYFWTDSHYPANTGNTPALIEALEKSASPRPVVYGGDALTYLDTMDTALAMQVSAVEQIRGAAPFFWVRGNHDFVNYTGKKREGITAKRKALSQWESIRLMEQYTSLLAVRDSEHPYSAYYYVDNEEAKIRNIVFEMTDKVEGNTIQYGVSDNQLNWIIREAVLGAPDGWKILFFSHVPPAGSGVESIRRIADVLEAFSVHKAVKVGDLVYDFSQRKDLQPLGLICGHFHKDYSEEIGKGIFQILVDSDSYTRRPQSVGTVEEQSFEYFSISKDCKTIRTVKIGAGQDRTFKLD